MEMKNGKEKTVYIFEGGASHIVGLELVKVLR